MDCDACNNLLLDHLYEELDGAGASAVRQHLQGCPACTEAFERLSLGRRAARSLPVLDAPAPSAALLAAIHAEAPAPKLRLVTGGSGSVAAEGPEPPRSKVPRWLQRVGEVAMRRQVAMAAVFLLMIGFGLSYHQLQAPTRPLPTSDDPGPAVIPARPVPTPAAPVGAAPRPHEERRPHARGANVERALDHRAATPTPTAARGGAPSPGEAQPAAPPAAMPAPPQRTWVATTAAARDDDAVSNGAPTTYRSQPPPPAVAPGVAATTERVSGNRDLDRGMPALQVESPTVVAQQANAPSPGLAGQQWGGAQQGAAQQAVLGAEPTNRLGQRAQGQVAQGVAVEEWRDLQQQGNTLNERGQSDAAIDAWRRALAANPPAAERRAIALRLVTALTREGRAAEASEVQAQHLSRTNSTVNVEGQVPSSVPPRQVSRPAPSRSMPARRGRQAPASSDAYSNMAY